MSCRGNVLQNVVLVVVPVVEAVLVVVTMALMTAVAQTV